MKHIVPAEFKVTRIRDCASPGSSIGTPAQAFEYWQLNIATAPWYDPNKESFVVFLLNTRKRILGHNLVALGTLDSCPVHPREVFRPVITASAHGLVLAHNHPSGDPSPSSADIRVTKDLLEASKLLRVELLDHLIIGDPSYLSMRQMGYLQDFSTCG